MLKFFGSSKSSKPNEKDEKEGNSKERTPNTKDKPPSRPQTTAGPPPATPPAEVASPAKSPVVSPIIKSPINEELDLFVFIMEIYIPKKSTIRRTSGKIFLSEDSSSTQDAINVSRLKKVDEAKLIELTADLGLEWDDEPFLFVAKKEAPKAKKPRGILNIIFCSSSYFQRITGCVFVVATATGCANNTVRNVARVWRAEQGSKCSSQEGARGPWNQRKSPQDQRQRRNKTKLLMR